MKTASMQAGAQRSLFTSDGRGFAAHRRILRKSLVHDFASSIRKRRTIEEPTAVRQVKASASSGPSSSIGYPPLLARHCLEYQSATYGSTQATYSRPRRPDRVVHAAVLKEL